MIEFVRPYLELLYFITGGPILAVFAFLALKQITVAKQNAKTASIRDSYRIAAEQVKVYASEVVPSLNQVDRLIDEKGIKLFSSSKIEIESDGVRVKNEWKDGELDKLIEIAPSLVLALNNLETFAVFFTSGVAAEKIAFSSVGPTYVRSVRKLLPAFIGLAEKKNYENILKLFLLWHGRMEGERLQEEKEKIQTRLKKLGGKTVKPIGTED